MRQHKYNQNKNTKCMEGTNNKRISLNTQQIRIWYNLILDLIVKFKALASLKLLIFGYRN